MRQPTSSRRTMANDPSDILPLVERLREGDRQELTDVFQRHWDLLRRTVELRMDARLQGRGDASDVLQDAFLDAATHLDTFSPWLGAAALPLAAAGRRPAALDRPPAALGNQDAE